MRTADGESLHGPVCVLAAPINTLARIALDPPLEADLEHALAGGHACRMTKLWMLATGVPDRTLAAGWGTPLHWLAAQEPAVDTAHGEAQLVVGFAVDGALDATDASAVGLRSGPTHPRRASRDASHDRNGDPWSRGGWANPPVGWADPQDHRATHRTARPRALRRLRRRARAPRLDRRRDRIRPRAGARCTRGASAGAVWFVVRGWVGGGGGGGGVWECGAVSRGLGGSARLRLVAGGGGCAVGLEGLVLGAQ